MQAREKRSYLKEDHSQQVHSKGSRIPLSQASRGQGVRQQADQWVTSLALSTHPWLIKGFCGFLQAVRHPFQQIVTGWPTNDEEKEQ